jgi:hypothetical protein
MPSGNYFQRQYWENLQLVDFNVKMSELRQMFENAYRHLPSEEYESPAVQERRQFLVQFLNEVQAFGNTIMSATQDNISNDLKTERKREFGRWFSESLETLAYNWDPYLRMNSLQRVKEQFELIKQSWRGENES